MKAFHSKRYEVVGHRQVIIDGTPQASWVLRARPVDGVRSFNENLVLIAECKFVDADGKIWKLLADGTKR